MTPKPPEKKQPKGKAIDWTDGDLDRLSEIHIDEDTPLMLSFVRRYGSPRLYALLTAKRPAEEEAADNA